MGGMGERKAGRRKEGGRESEGGRRRLLCMWGVCVPV
jgi:hypothetical protein